MKKVALFLLLSLSAASVFARMPLKVFDPAELGGVATYAGYVD